MKRTASVQSVLLVHHQAISGTCFALIDAGQWEIPLCLQMILRSTIVFLGLLLHVTLNWAPILNCASHVRTKGSMFDRKIGIENIDAGTISDIHRLSQYAGLGENKTVSNQINIWLVSCFHFSSFPCVWVADQPIENAAKFITFWSHIVGAGFVR